MTHNAYECVHKIRYRWQKEQQLIRKKYQIPYNVTYTSNRCFDKHPMILSKFESLLKYEKQTIIDNNDHKTTHYQSDKYFSNMKSNDSNNVTKSYLNRTKCSCSNRLLKSHVTDELSNRFSVQSPNKQDLLIDSSLIDLSSSEQMTSQTIHPNQYVLLNWNNRQSLINFIRTTEFNRNLSTMSIEQLHELITSHTYIHVFHSMIDFILFLNEEHHEKNLTHIYIDPSYYSTIQDIKPFYQSQIIADNINLNRVLRSIEKIAYLLGVKLNQSINKSLEDKIPTKQRNSILNQQSLLIASKIPYNTFHNSTVHT